VFRSVTTRMYSPAGDRSVSATRVINIVRTVGLVVVVVTTAWLARPGPASGGARGPAIAIMLGVSAAAWIAWILSDGRPRLMTWSLVVMGGAGGVLAGLSPNGPAVAVGCVAAFAAGARLSTAASLAVTAETVAAYLITGLINGIGTAELLGYAWAFVGLWTVALTRNEFLARAIQAERTLAETRRVREAETQAAAFAERARIARDLHDVLAHSLAAVSVNLQAAEGLLTSDTLPADNPDLVKAIECIDRAGTLTRDGLAAAKRAVLALRDDAPPLPDQLASLAEQYRAVGDPAVNFEVSGQPRPIPPEIGQAAYRTAQEALTNARKHAPGEPITVRLNYQPDEITLNVVNPLSPASAETPLADTGAGFGLVGLRERAALAGGTFEAGPDAGNWHVQLRIPA
jgi:signal transduction histidine kinase